MRIITGTYTGNNNNNRAITGVGFAPRLVFIKARAGGSIWWKCTAHGANQCNNLMGTGQLNTSSSGWNSLDADGFTVSAGMNQSGTTYDWTAFSPDDNVLQVGTYTGLNGADNRQITCATGFVPVMVMAAKNATGSTLCFWSNPSGGDYTGFPGFSTSWTSDYIQGTHANGFTVGTQLNTNGVAVYWFAFKANEGNVFVGTYDGTSTTSRDISMGDAFQPTHLYLVGRAISNGSGRYPSWRDHGHTGDQTYNSYWGYAAAELIKTFLASGFRVGNTNYDVNTTGYRYVYIAFKDKDDTLLFDRVVPVRYRTQMALDRALLIRHLLPVRFDRELFAWWDTGNLLRFDRALPVNYRLHLMVSRALSLGWRFSPVLLVDRQIPVQYKANVAFDKILPVLVAALTDPAAAAWVREHDPEVAAFIAGVAAANPDWVAEDGATGNWS